MNENFAPVFGSVMKKVEGRGGVVKVKTRKSKLRSEKCDSKIEFFISTFQFENLLFNSTFYFVNRLLIFDFDFSL